MFIINTVECKTEFLKKFPLISKEILFSLSNLEIYVYDHLNKSLRAIFLCNFGIVGYSGINLQG